MATDVSQPGWGRRALRWIGRGLALLLLAGLVAFAIAAWTQRDIPASVLEARYATPPSKFIEVDGVRFHYRDEGSGPVVVLMHANFSNLLDWEPWVDALKDHYRVVRFDMTSHGLTGPDPTGDYTLERTLKLTEDLFDALGLQKVTLAGISLGGTVSIHYAAKHPERVERLVLLNPGSLEGKERARGGLPKAAYVLTYVLPRALPRSMLKSGFGDPSRLPESLVDRWYDLWLREGQREAQLDRLAQYKSGNIDGLIRSLRMPVLLLWGKENKTATFEQSATFLELLQGAPAVKFIAYPGLGHMAVEEDGARIGRDVRAWLDASTMATTPAAATPTAKATTPAAATAKTSTPAAAPSTSTSTAVSDADAPAPQVARLPSPASPGFCVAMQQRTASTALVGRNQVFDEMPAFRHSKPRVRPLEIYQVVTYLDELPVRVSCKMKTAAQLRAVYGATAAGEQHGCPEITQALLAEAIARLQQAGRADAARRAASFVVDADEPYVTGAAYLEAYPLSHVDAQGRVHLRSVGLFQDYDSWITMFLPEILKGQCYCHWPTAEYLAALATGAVPPGTRVGTEDDAPTRPRKA